MRSSTTQRVRQGSFQIGWRPDGVNAVARGPGVCNITLHAVGKTFSVLQPVTIAHAVGRESPMRKAIPFLLILLGSLLSVAAEAQDAASRRVALVIGNAEYVNAAKLPNPANDATAVAAMLEGAGFVVEMHTDLGNSE